MKFLGQVFKSVSEGIPIVTKWNRNNWSIIQWFRRYRRTYWTIRYLYECNFLDSLSVFYLIKFDNLELKIALFEESIKLITEKFNELETLIAEMNITTSNAVAFILEEVEKFEIEIED